MESVQLGDAKAAISVCNSSDKLKAAKFAIQNISTADRSALSAAVLELEILIATLKEK